MKVLFIARASLYKDPGGDTVQVVKTAEHLRKINIGVDIQLADEEMDYSSYDLLHFFNIIRPADILFHVRKSRKPFVVSTIFVEYAEFERTARRGMLGLMFKMFPADFVEYLKVIARSAIGGERIVSWNYILLGHKRSVRKVAKNAAMLLPNSLSEMKRFETHYGVKTRFRVIPNAIDESLFGRHSAERRDQQMVICVARIEGRKNQLNLIRALNGTNFQLLIIGPSSLNQKKYFTTCVAEASSNVRFIDRIAQEELVKYYQKAKVHALPSWFETTGLSSLEAAAMGCNIVITDKGDTVEYFGNDAFYCDPASPESILDAVRRAAASEEKTLLANKISREFTWVQTALETLTAYEEVLRIKS